MTTTPPPSPAGATGEAAFMAELRRLKAWSGLSFRQLDRRATAAGEVLPYSTAATMLGRNRLPREELLVAFVTACGLDGDGVQRWVAVRAAIATGGRDERPASVPPASHDDTSSARRPRRGAVIAAAALAAALLGGLGLATAHQADDVRETVTGENVTTGRLPVGEAPTSPR